MAGRRGRRVEEYSRGADTLLGVCPGGVPWGAGRERGYAGGCGGDGAGGQSAGGTVGRARRSGRGRRVHGGHRNRQAEAWRAPVLRCGLLRGWGDHVRSSVREGVAGPRRRGRGGQPTGAARGCRGCWGSIQPRTALGAWGRAGGQLRERADARGGVVSGPCQQRYGDGRRQDSGRQAGHGRGARRFVRPDARRARGVGGSRRSAPGAARHIRACRSPTWTSRRLV